MTHGLGKWALVVALSALGCGGAKTGPSEDARPTASVSVTPPASASASAAGPAVSFDFATLQPLDDKLFPKGTCGGFETHPMSKATESMIEDRFTLVPFEGLTNNLRGHDIMSAPYSSQRETRLFGLEGQKKFVVYAAETFARPGANFVEAIKKTDESFAGSFVGKMKLGGLDALALVPKKLTAAGDRADALVLYLVMPDDSVIRVLFAVSPDIVDNGVGCSRLARTIAESLVVGKRRLVTGGKQKLSDGVSLELPPSFLTYPQHGPDFDVWWITEVAAFDAPNGSFGIYLGGHPQHLPEGQKEVSGRLLGKPVTWVETGEGDVHGRQTIIEIDSGTLMHVFFNAEGQALFDTYMKIAASIKVGPK